MPCNSQHGTESLLTFGAGAAFCASMASPCPYILSDVGRGRQVEGCPLSLVINHHQLGINCHLFTINRHQYHH